VCKTQKVAAVLFLMLPLVIAIPFYLIAEIDSPNHGLIEVTAQNLISLAESLRREFTGVAGW